ncbi:competence type IV pilus minor pilin ComGG [Bacillus atrophaeus]|uniref:competence type IV pilus minor pilin ComGG n=1 Tax=Bacillus atrophaeus TaxID=1452 RepID=UPI0002EEE9AE|nr:competence type IV pilus minor pilin ComGG [Bacillus atrophaeus]
MSRSKGFIYPAVLFAAAVILLVVGYTSSEYITRKTFEKETKEFYIRENLLQNGALLSIRHMLEARQGQKGSRQFEYGLVSYQIQSTSKKEQKEINVKSVTNSGSEMTARFIFDLKQKKLFIGKNKWEETYKKQRLRQHFIIKAYEVVT